MRPEFSGEKAQDSAFTEALAALKQNGSNIIVVGANGESAHAAVCERLLGADSLRQRLVVRTDPDASCGWVPDDATEGATDVVSYGGAHAEDADTVVDSELLGPLGKTVARSIDEVASDDAGLEPAELRVCFDGLDPLFADHESETVFRLVHVLTARIREVQGMGHFHIRVDEDEDHVRLLEPLFDAIVVVRSSSGTAEHRWRLPDQDIESEWFEL